MTPRVRGEHGETLLELLITVMILGTAIVAVLAGIAVAANISDEHKKEVGVEVVLRDYAEAVAGSTYNGCAVPTNIAYTAPTGYALSAPVVTGCYDGTSTSGGYGATGTGGVVRLRLEAHSSDPVSSPHFRTKTVEVVKSVDYVRPS
jgi:type II secretory pathway pseudopilin PulG